LMTSLSGFLDGQKIQLQENPEGLKGGQQPEKITIYLDDDLVGKIYPGDRIKINGIVQGIQRRKGNVKLISFDFVIVANNLENITSLYEDIIITDVDIKEIKKVASNPQIHEMLRDSLVPSIHGYKIEKEGAILQLFGGNSKELPDGTKIRGDIHSLFVGDPGIGKSQLLYGIYKLSPRGIFSTGTGASGVGLTAAAVKDDFGDGQWSLEAGALVLADGGIACIDEIDKMDETDRENLHPAMEQQEIPISKAGINATLKSRCAVMATANPKFGRFDEYMPLTKQIELSSVLLSRFDLIWTIQDKPKPDIDLKLAKYILNTRRNPKNKDNAPVFEPEFIRKYIAYAKQNCKPELTDEAQEKIQDFYVDMRKISNETIAITPRQLESIVRLSEASAKVRLSKEVLISDVDRAIRIINEYLKRVCTDWETGKIDVDTIFIGTTHTQQERMKIIRSIIENSPDGMANIDDIIQEAEIKGIESNKTKEALEQMKQDKYIFENGKGRFKIQC
ncbi:MAG: minichromosome maintenance protein MCM, partial [Actinobacteria bacterium]|nr:minichromosome maintenance protein MCM [Actinomycetota bacterium]